MHDQSLEPKLRAALRSAGDDLSFTITAEELERRLILRRRGGLSPMASLGLAAAVGIGLIGLAAVVGGWFDPHPAIVPVPSPSPAIARGSSSPTPAPSTNGSALPSLDQLLVDIDPARVVRAEAVGPYASLGDQNGENHEPIPPGSVTFDPVAASGSYDVIAVCSGELGIIVGTVRADPGQPAEEVTLTCDGARTIRQMGLATGDALRVQSPGNSGWRVVLLAPARPAPHANALDETAVDPAVGDVLIDARSTTPVPSYGDVLTGGGIETRLILGTVPTRARFDVYVACAGPSSIRYAFGGERPQDEAVDPGMTIDYAAGQVECDGTLQHDTINVALGAELSVTAEDRTAWRIVVTAEKPPISLPANRGGWALSTGFGPNYFSNGQPQGASLIGAENSGPVRVVITCAGATTLTGTIDTGQVDPDPFTIDCSSQPSGTTLVRTYHDAVGQIQIFANPNGVPIWLAVTSQVRAPADPAP